MYNNLLKLAKKDPIFRKKLLASIINNEVDPILDYIFEADSQSLKAATLISNAFRYYFEAAQLLNKINPSNGSSLKEISFSYDKMHKEILKNLKETHKIIMILNQKKENKTASKKQSSQNFRSLLG